MVAHGQQSTETLVGVPSQMPESGPQDQAAQAKCPEVDPVRACVTGLPCSCSPQVCSLTTVSHPYQAQVSGPEIPFVRRKSE